MKTESIEQRLARLESRVVQLMLHFGLNPYQRTYAGEANTQQKELAKAHTSN